MVTPRDEDAGRLELLEQWAAEQADLAEQRRRVAGREDLFERIANRFLDRGMHTGGRVIEREHLDTRQFGYLPSAWHTLPRALRYTGVDRNGTFIDFGCGKGRVVHQAARRRFGRVIGVEITPSLAEAARAALESRKHQHRCKDVEIVVADAREFEIPDDLSIAYFFHPFRGEILDAVLENIVASIDRNPRRVWVIYSYPLAGAQVEATGRFRLVKELRGGFRSYSLHRTSIYESC